MKNKINNETYKIYLIEKIEQLNKIRKSKINNLASFCKELRETMLDNGQISANQNIDFQDIMNTYSRFSSEKEKLLKNNTPENLKKFEIISKYVENLNTQLTSLGNDLINPCEFEETLRLHIKYVDTEIINAELPILNPMLYDMKKEYIFQLIRDLYNINTDNIKEENTLAYEDLIRHLIDIQETTIKLHTFQTDIEYEEQRIDENIDKDSPEEIIYFENYMATLKRSLKFLTINIIKQNTNALKFKLTKNLNFYEYEKNILEMEYESLKNFTLEHIQTFKGTSFLPSNYAKSCETSIDLVNSFSIEKNKTKTKTK